MALPSAPIIPCVCDLMTSKQGILAIALLEFEAKSAQVDLKVLAMLTAGLLVAGECSGTYPSIPKVRHYLLRELSSRKESQKTQ